MRRLIQIVTLTAVLIFPIFYSPLSNNGSNMAFGDFLRNLFQPKQAYAQTYSGGQVGTGGPTNQPRNYTPPAPSPIQRSSAPAGPGLGWHGDYYNPSSGRVQNTPVLPQTGGQPTGGGGNTGGDATVSAPTPQPSGPSEDEMARQREMEILRSAYGQARSDIEGQGPQLDQSYNLAKGDIEGGMKEAETTATQRRGDLETQYGDILRNQLRTYQDLARQRQGVFSSLGTLDSSAFGEQQFRADQSLAEQRGKTDMEKGRSLNEVNSAFDSYKRQAGSELSRLALQYQSGKQAIASALAQNNIQEAAAINQALENIRARAQQVQDNMKNFAMQAAVLKQQGVDVIGTLRGITGDAYANQVQGQLSGARAFGSSLVPNMSTMPIGQGYIGKSGKRYNTEEEARLVGDRR